MSAGELILPYNRGLSLMRCDTGGDLAYAFVKQLVGFEIAEIVRGTVEISIHEQDEDEFAAFHGLV